MSGSFTPEFYVSVDVEASGPIPGEYSLLSIGACSIFEPRSSFYVELKPLNNNFTEEAMSIHHLSLALLSEQAEGRTQPSVSFLTAHYRWEDEKQWMRLSGYH